ncbi:M48 family metalloprotease, partial [candidate division NPL-UPA2 bacterium]|nr:M48 family metalloprotease [candidate division NPL-UPA2 bacterium]
MKKLWKCLLPALFLILSGCATTFNPATGRREWIIYTREQEIALGQAVARRVEEEYGIVEGERARRVERIGRKVAFVSSRKALPYSFRVLDREDLNALALPGGPVYITKALVDELNDDELAAVLGHEVAHITARHGVKRLQAHRLSTLLT